MVGLGARADGGVLHFHEIADMGSLADIGAGTQARIGPDDGARRHFCALQMRIGADDGAAFHHHAGTEDHKRFDQRVVADFSVVREIHRLGRGHADTGIEEAAADGLLHQAFGARQFGAAVHAHHHRLVGEGQRAFDALGAGDDGHVGKVIFALGILVLQRPGPAEEFRRLGGIKTAVAEGDAAFGLRGVLELDDAAQKTVRRHQHPAVRGRIGGVERRQAQAGARLRLEQVGDGLRRDQGGIARRDHQRAVKSGQRVPGGGGGMARAQLLVLDGGRAAQRGGIGAHRFARGRRHHHDAVHPGAAQRLDDMAQHRKARNLVQDLGQAGFHAGAGARSQNDGGFIHAGACLFSCRNVPDRGRSRQGKSRLPENRSRVLRQG